MEEYYVDHNLLCPVCGGTSSLLDVVDFNKSCIEGSGTFLKHSGTPVYYSCCNECGFCFAPKFLTWKIEEFEERVYNSEYISVDPDYIEIRPQTNAAYLISMFGDQVYFIKHLDYGGGNGLLAKLLRESKWQSTSYDPFVDRDMNIEHLGKFDLITAFEVFEHVPDPHVLMANLRSLLAPNGVILFTTLLSDGNIQPDQRLSWWYASPRNGHISLFSKNSLAILAHKYGFDYLLGGNHVFYINTIPSWAKEIQTRLWLKCMSEKMPKCWAAASTVAKCLRYVKNSVKSSKI